MKRVVIFFPWEWVAYSPTILNLVEILRETAVVRVIAIDNGNYDNSRLDSEVYYLIRIPPAFFKGAALVGIYGMLKQWLFVKALSPEAEDVVIGVDNLGAVCAQTLYREIHFLSLEIKRDRLFKQVDWGRVCSVAIQSETRLRYLFPDGSPAPVFHLPNSPILDSMPLVKKEEHGGQLVFFGNIKPAHGVYQCIEAVAGMSGASLTLKGPITRRVRRRIVSRYQRLFKERRLFIDETYLSQAEVVPYLQKFDAGFCFYDFDIVKKGDYNYISSPSGKLYNYFAAGVPVIGSDIVGLADVRCFDAGLLLSELSPAAIRRAVSNILADAKRFRRGCLEAAAARNFVPYAALYRAMLCS